MSSALVATSFVASKCVVCCGSTSTSSCRPSTSYRCLPSLSTFSPLSPRTPGRTTRLSPPADRKRNLKQKLACSKDNPPSDSCTGLLSANEPPTAIGTCALIPLFSQLLLSTSLSKSHKILKYESPRVYAMAKHKGRVGTYKREGNVSTACFGVKLHKDKKGKKVDSTRAISKLLPFVVAATAVAALTQPASFTWVTKEYYPPALGGIMLSIGVQLSVSDFALVAKRPLPVLIGYFAQYAVKPLLGLAIVKLFSVPAAFASGLILTSCVAGAQLSSYATFLSGGEVALSIVLTSLTTITSVAVTPLLTRLLIGSVVPVDLVAMASSIMQVVIAPVVLGLALNTYAKPLVEKTRMLMPIIAMACTSLCIGSPLALNRARIISSQGIQLLVPVLCFHIGAFILGYWICRVPLWRQSETESRTIALCTGMQSSTLAMLLASQFLGGSNAVPPACSVVVMALMGLSLASFWGKGLHVREFLGNLVSGYNLDLGLI